LILVPEIRFDDVYPFGNDVFSAGLRRVLGHGLDVVLVVAGQKVVENAPP
jgi:hypothetical protein